MSKVTYLWIYANILIDEENSVCNLINNKYQVRIWTFMWNFLIECREVSVFADGNTIMSTTLLLQHMLFGFTWRLSWCKQIIIKWNNPVNHVFIKVFFASFRSINQNQLQQSNMFFKHNSINITRKQLQAIFHCN